MTAIRVRRRRQPVMAAASGGEPRLCGCGLRVDDDERLHMINACAFFRAERFREADPASIRGEDVRKAAKEVDSVLQRRKKPKKR